MREVETDPLVNHRTGGDAGASSLPRAIAIIGAGRAGRSLAAAAELAGLDARLAGRDDAHDALRDAEVALLCVPDSQIASAAERVADAAPGLSLVGHVSGSTTLAALEPASRRGARTFSLHPLQTIPDPRTRLAGACCAISGSDAEAVEFARSLAELLEMRPFELDDERRAVYHAAASIASNFLVALEEDAAGLLERAGVPAGRELLAPLVLATAANWAERGADALTGPIARGDEATVASHLAELDRHAPELVGVYRALAERTRAVAEGRS